MTDRLVLFGGNLAAGNAVAEPTNETWSFAANGWVPGPLTLVASSQTPPLLVSDPAGGRLLLLEFTPQRPVATWERRGLLWSYLPLPRMPDYRAGAVAAFDPVRQRVVLFGGIDGATEKLDVWEFDGRDWTAIAARGPAGRDHAALAWDGARNRLVLFGGRLLGNPQLPANDMWDWDGTSWTRLTPLTLPAPRYHHSMAWNPLRNRVVLFGGNTAPAGGLLDDTWEWDGSAWRPIGSIVRPAARAGHAMTMDPRRGAVVLVAGHGANGLLSDVWELASNVWRPIATPTTPTERQDTAIGSDRARQQIVLFGGLDRSGGTLGDTWVWRDNDWQLREPFNAPPARAGHALATDPLTRGVVLFGGSLGVAVADDTWVFDGANWTRAVPALSPPARVGHAMAYDAARNRVVLFGGQAGALLNDTWEWDGATWTRNVTAAPSPRAAHAMAYDAARARVVLSGGRAGNLDLADTWTYDGSTWSQVVGGDLPAPRSEHAMEFDAATGAVYSFGGTTAAGVTPGLTVWNGTAWSDRLAIGPRQRTQHALAYDFGQRRIVMFGGRSQFDPTRDTWLLTSNPFGIASPREGTGCGSGSGGSAAVLQPFGRPYAGNRGFAIDLFTPRRQPTVQQAVFLLSAAEASVQFGACRLAIDPNALLAAVPAAESRGFATLPLPLPTAPALFGTTLFVQAVHRDPPTPLDGLALSLSLWLAIGDR